MSTVTAANQDGRAPARRRASSEFYWDSLFTDDQEDDSLGRLMASTLEPGMISLAATHSSPEEFARIIARDITKWKKVVQEGNIKVQ